MSARVRLFGWREVLNGLDAVAFRRRLEREIRHANQRIGREAVAVVRRQIRGGAYAPNAATTAFLKASSRPLVNTGELFQSISFDTPAWNVARIGLLRATMGPEAVNIGIALHEGYTITVTDRVRARFMAMIRAAAGMTGSLGRDAQGRFRRRGVLPPLSGPARSVWIVPPRPYLEDPLSSAGFRGFVFDAWSQAARRALAGAR